MSGQDLFGRPLPSSSRPALFPRNAVDDAKMQAFRKLKPTCVQLMGIATQSPTQTSQHASLLAMLTATARDLPDAAFTPSLISYILFPLTTTLRQAASPSTLPENFLEAAFGLIALVVRHWRSAPGGMEPAAWEQLWRFTVAAVTPGGKGKARELGQETRLAALEVLLALLEPHIEAGVAHPSPAMRKTVSSSKAPLMPTLFQSITLAVDSVALAPPNAPLQRSAVELVRVLVGYISGQSEILAAVLPGVVSSMAKGISVKGVKGNVAAEMGGAIQDVVVETLADEALRRLRVLRKQANDLADLVDDWEQDTETAPPSPTLSQASTVAPGNPFPPLTASYLDFTATQLQSTIPPILTALAAHASDLARNAASGLAYALVTQCHESLARLTPPSLSTLLMLSRDDFDPVRDNALHKLHQLLGDDSLTGLDAALVDILSNAINSLPRLIRSEQDARVDDAARLITAIAEVTSASPRPNAIAHLLGPGGNVERWAWSLLDCLEFGRPRGWSTMDNSAERTAELGWGGGLVTSSLPLLIDSSGDTVPPPPDARFPHLPLRHVEAERTARALGDMLEALGNAGGETALYSVDYFVRFAKAHRQSAPAQAVSAVWVADLLFRGVASAFEGERASREVRKMARSVTRVLVAMDDEDDEDAEWTGEGSENPADSLIPIERTKGLDALTTLLDKNVNHQSARAETTRLHAAAQRILLAAQGLRALSSCAHILGTSFRPLLLNTLYELLAHLSSPHALVREYAEVALVRIAYDTGYASAQNLVLDNVDYVVNVVSQRLTYHRLSPHAPLVLIAMIRLVGAPIVPLVHDVVDDIFDALDDYHGYSALASALLAVLTTLIDAMAAEIASTGPTAEREASRAETRRFLAAPNPKADFKIAQWYNSRSALARKEVDEILARAPHKAWGEDKIEEDPPKDPEPTPPTRGEEVCAQILAKATYYLSHASPALRARVLGLLAHGIPVLAQAGREADVLPTIDKAWPVLLARLDDAEPFVVAAAVEVLAALGEYLGDYVSARLAAAWPKLLKMMNAQADADRRSALARRGARGTESAFTVSHRLHLALLRVATFVAREVPVKDGVLWDMMLAFRPLLDRRGHEEMQAAAVGLFRALGERDGDAVWVVLRATSGRLDGDRVWGYLYDAALEIGENVQRVLG